MKHLKLFLALLALVGVSLTTNAQISWTDKTSLITNPSFEDDDAILDLKGCGWATDRVNGWTIAPSSSSNAQIGIGNSSSTIQGIGDTFAPSDGEKYFYTRNNWNKDTDYSFTQVITRDGDNLKAGLYKLSCKAATYSSDAAFNTLTLGLKEGTGSAVTHDGIVLNVWNTWGVIIYKKADDTNLTIEVKFKPGYDGGSKHYALLMDDFHLEYISEADALVASSTNTIDFSDIINNAGIYNHSTKGTMPRGWVAPKHTTGNGNYTEGEKGDTRFEGWNGGNLDIDYNQTITNLPAGIYTVTANAHERAEVGRTFVYASTEGQDEATGLVNSATDADITTSALKVSNGTMKIGIKSTANDWVTADDFRISFLGFDVDAVKAEYETALSNAETARDADENSNIVGQEKSTFASVITEYTTEETQSYVWYVNAKEALENAITDFISVRATYDALAREIDKATALGFDGSSYAATSSSTAATALTNTQNLKVAEYTYVITNYQHGVELGEWTSKGTNTSAADFENEHWSGTAHKYKNQNDNNGQGWNANSWSINFSQNVTLPPGNYVFKVAGRQAQGDQVMTSLVVTQGETTLGTVNDFPRGNSSRGINKSGETAFEGDNNEFANSGNGYGWEWRYVKFTLANNATVNIAINSVATAKYQWVSFGDYTLQTDNEANISMIAYNVALNSANTVLEDATYANVGGTDKSNLEAAIAADPGSTTESIDAATTALNNARETFTAGVDSWNAYVQAKDATYEKDQPYASEEKYDAIAAVWSVDPTTASEAATKAAAITSAYRRYIESNALAEGVDGAEDKTSLISDPNMEVTYDATNHTFGAWQVFGQTDGTINLKTESDQPLTDSEGHQYKYADIWKSDNNGGIKQTINLPAGKYLLTVAARGQNATDATFGLFAGTDRVEIPLMNSTGGVFGNGWNDVSVEFVVPTASDVEIGVQSGNGKTMWWGATRFRLVRISDVETVKIAVTAAGFATFSCDKALYFENENIAAYTATVNGGEITLTKVTKVPANTGLLIRSLAGGKANEDIIVLSSAPEIKNNALHATTKDMDDEALAGKYILANGSKGVGFYKAGSGASLKAGQAYLEAGTSAKAFFAIEGVPTGINAVENADADTNVIYNLSGQRVNNAFKGIVIKNGKKVLVK